MSKSKSHQSSRQNAAKSASNAGKKVAHSASGTTQGSTGSGLSAAKKPVSTASTLSTNSAKQSVQPTPKTLTRDTAKAEKLVSTATTSSTKVVNRPAQPTTKALTKDAIKYERRQAERQQRYLAQQRARRNKTFAIIAAIILVASFAGLTTYFIYQSRHASAQTASAPAPYQEAVYNTDYPPVDNVYCDQLEGQVTHIHAHISIYINGQASALPAYVGIPQNSSSGSATCYYWLHTHDSTGVIHIESPASADERFTLGQFLDEWNQQFNSLGFPNQLLLKNGWTIWINGKAYHGSLTNIPLDAHNLITIAYNSPNVKPDTTYAWNGL